MVKIEKHIREITRRYLAEHGVRLPPEGIMWGPMALNESEIIKLVDEIILLIKEEYHD